LFKKIILALTFSMLMLLSGCFISNTEPIYLQRITAYQEGNFLSGTLYHHNGTGWVPYDQYTKDRADVYMSFTVSEGSPLEVYFYTYSPDKEIHDMKLTISKDLDYTTNIGEEAVILDREGDIIQSSYLFESISREQNVISIYGWWTNDGPKYVGAKTAGTNYVLKGVRFLFESSND